MSPYREAAALYLPTGLGGPLPLPAQRKKAPPAGWTGKDAPYPSGADVWAWSEERPDGNVGLRLADNVLGIDVDCYAGKPGGQTLARLEAQLGKLPPTWTSTSRTDGSGIRLFRVPTGRSWPGVLEATHADGHTTQGIETVHKSHRYAVCWPSLHPEGRQYVWLDPKGNVADGPPKADELPALPASWLEHLDRGEQNAASKADMTSEQTRAWLTRLDDGEPCQRVRAERSRVAEALSQDSRHEAALALTALLVRLGEKGHRGVPSALDVARAAFLERVTGPGEDRSEGEALAEWARMVDGAVRLVLGDPSFPATTSCTCPADYVSVDGGTLDTATGELVAEEPQTPTVTPAGAAPAPLRRLKVTRASEMQVRPVHWFWKDRLPIGSLALIAGREGIGKSTVSYQLAADVTRGKLEGRYLDQPRSVVIAATEDSWEHTIVPRLMGAGADLDRILRVDVVTSDDYDSTLSLPRDLRALEHLVMQEEVALILLDPLMSRLGSNLDTHKDADVRQALEPLTALADRTGSAILGLIHVNKSQSVDPLNLIMASKAFPAVARAVLFVMKDPEDESLRLLGQEKNNLGRDNLPTLTFRIESAHVADTPEGPVTTARVAWQGESSQTISEALQSAGEGETRSATNEAGDWLFDYITSKGGEADSADIKEAGRKAGHSQDALKRARSRLKMPIESYGMPRRTKWSLPSAFGQWEQPPGETAPTALTALTALTETQTGAVGAVSAVGAPLPDVALTGRSHSGPVCARCGSEAVQPYGDGDRLCPSCRAEVSR
ncbi:MAG: hypothetical protein JWP11_1506 [Frankiales bacterium]|nr:hypothetical protein [Frankiales bacterium]